MNLHYTSNSEDDFEARQVDLEDYIASLSAKFSQKEHQKELY